MIELNERERAILRCVVQNFILTANPVGSRVISKKYDVGISPASIRNVMGDLEELGLIFHPHTSAGRVPTDKGYRLYVDLLMESSALTLEEKKDINRHLEESIEDKEELLKSTTMILGKLSSQLAMVTYPNIIKSVLEKLQLVNLPHNKMMVILSLKSGFIRTITLEIPMNVTTEKLEKVQTLINERICGLSLESIRNSFEDRLKDLAFEKTGIIRLFLNSVNKIFSDASDSEKVHFSGVKNIFQVPEFQQNDNIQGIVELMEDKEIVLHVLDKAKEFSDDSVTVSIGTENQFGKLNDYSLITAHYSSGDSKGALGIVGPRRMNYSKMIAIVDYMSKFLTEVLTTDKK